MTTSVSPERVVAGIQVELASRYATVLDGSASLRAHLASKLGEWSEQTKSALHTEFPHATHEDILQRWRPQLETPPLSDDEGRRAAGDFLDFCKQAKLPVEEAFWNKQFITAPVPSVQERKMADSSVSARLLLQQWQKGMDQTRVQWELREIAARRAQVMEQLVALLEMLEQLHERLHELGLDPGLLFDLSKGALSEQDMRQFERWARYLAQDEGIKRLCDLLGRMRQIELSERIERVRTGRSVTAVLPDIDSREEIVGIRLGRDIEHALPSELALLADPDTALLFDLKYVEAALMCFDMQGMVNVALQVEIEQDVGVMYGEQQGPMVICIDTSSSMQGAPETVAKAVALFLAAKARQGKRACYLINFSTSIDTLDFGAEMKFESLLRFLKMSFHGGTDVAPALAHALGKMEEEAYRHADLVVISDFVMSDLSGALLQRLERRRLEGNRFHSLVVGDACMSRRMRTHFDNEWIYDPDNGLIHELLGFERKMSNPDR